MQLSASRFPLSVSVSLFSLSVSPLSSPPLTTAPGPKHKEPVGRPQTEKFPKCFPVIAFCWAYFYHLHLVFYSFLYCFVVSFWPKFSQAACHCCWSGTLCHIFPHLRHEFLEICVSIMTASFMTLCSSSLLHPSRQTPRHVLYPLCSHTSTNTYHISHQHGA